MLSVVASSYSLADPQIDGRCWVTETLTISDGSVLTSSYLAAVGADYQAHLDDMVAAANSQFMGPG